MIDVVIPADMWEEDMEGVIVSWLYRDGATIEEGKPICEVMVEKAQMDLIAPAAGILHIKSEADAIVTKGQLVAQISPD